MPTYGENEFKESNVNYINKDFNALKQSLISYAQSYFPNTYKDFNETSPGMMLIEMNAYVGDVLSFYIDQQYKEMLLPLAEERRNIINMAKMLGYKVKPIVPAFTELSFKSEINAQSADRSKVDYTNASVFSEGIKVKSTANTNLFFETLDVVDFTVEQADDITSPVIDTDTDGLITDYTLTRKIRAVSGETKTKDFTITAPEKFKKITLPETNVIDIISCIDSNNNEWYEVDFLAQDQVPVKKHYSQDAARDSAYTNFDGSSYVSDVPVPYSLQYIKTTKRFTRETNNDNTTSLVFGNGILKNGTIVGENFLDLEQLGIIIPGQTNDLNEAIDPLLGDEYSTLGETPSQTTLTITYRVGGGIESNASVGDLTQVVGTPVKLKDGGTNIDSVTNDIGARGGADKEDTDEIREKAKAFFTTQNRCVTKEDYEARVLNMTSRFGSIAKVVVSRNEVPPATDIQEAYESAIQPQITDISENRRQTYENLRDLTDELLGSGEYLADVVDAISAEINFNLGTAGTIQTGLNTLSAAPFIDSLDADFGTINVTILSYDRNKNLVGNPQAGTAFLPDATDNTPDILNANLSNYLNNFKLLTDDVAISDGYIVNFGVIFDVVAHQYANKQEVKLKCIQKIIDYFKIEKMQFNQPILLSQLEYELMGIDGVRAVNYVCVTQDIDYVGAGEGFTPGLFKYTYDGSTLTEDGTDGYGYSYDFQTALRDGIILPVNPDNPAVFELKNPRQNVKGVVR